MGRQRKVSGFTLLELLCTLGIVAVVLGFAVPSFARMLADAELRAASSGLSVALAGARLRAVETRQAVSVCPLDAGGRCAPGSDWSRGWMVFDDPRRAGVPANRDAVVEVARQSGAGSIRSTSGRALLTFRPDGTSAGSNVTLSLCNADHPGLGRQVVVNNVGRTRSGPLPPGWACPSRRA
jgi:type IV fimbrial biogenesis protein FimT